MDTKRRKKGTKKQQKTDENRPKLTALEQRAIQLVKENPMLSNYQIGKKLKELGASANARSIYVRLKKNEYLNGEIEKIRQANLEMMSREIVPEALKIHKKALKLQPLKDIFCTNKKLVVNIDRECKGCADRSICSDLLKYRQSINKHLAEKREWVSLAEKAEFRIDETKQPYVPANINFTEIRALIRQTINTDVVKTPTVDDDSWKTLSPSGDHDKA